MRRVFRYLAGCFTAALLIVFQSAIAFPAPTAKDFSSSYLVYVGTRGKDSKGIYAYRFDPRTGKVDSLGVAAEIEMPTWIAVHPDQKTLYAVSELGNDGRAMDLSQATALIIAADI